MSLSHKIWHFSKGCFFPGHWGRWESLRTSPLWASSWLATALQVSWHSPTGFPSQMFWRLLSGAGLKSWWGSMSDSKPSVLREIVLGLICLPPVCCCTGVVYGEAVSQILLPTLMWSSHLTDVNGSLCHFLGSPPRGIFSYIAIDAMCLWEEVMSTSS